MHSVKKNLLFTSTYNIIYVLTPLVTTPYISRILGSDGIGDYSYAFSVATFFTLFIRLGLNTYGNRTIATVRDNKPMLSRCFCEIYVMQFLCGVIFSSAYFIWTFVFAPKFVLSICLSLYVLSSAVDITWFLYGVEDFVVTTIRDIFVRLSTVLLIFGLVKANDDLWKYTLIQGMGFLVGQLLAWLRIRKHVVAIWPRIDKVLSHLKPNLILFIPSIAVSIYKTMDKIMLGTMAASSELGYYESSEKVINVPMAVITALGTVMLPRMSNMVASDADKDRMDHLIRKSIIFTTFISSLLCFGLMAVADQFVPLFYGNGFEKCVMVYAWLLPSCVFLAFANVIRTQVLLPQNRDKEYIFSLMAGAFVNLILNAVLIPIFASVGAAMATLSAEASVWLVQTIEVRKDQKIWGLISEALPFVVAGLLMFVCCRNASFTMELCRGGKIPALFGKVAFCGFVYFAFLGTLKALKYLIALVDSGAFGKRV